MEKQRLPRIAWFSRFNQDALPPSASSSAYFSDVVLPIVHSAFEVDLFGKEEGRLNDQKILHYVTAGSRHKENPYDLFFYQLEDSQECDFIKIHLGLIPGVTLFHDIVWSTDVPPPLTFSVWREFLKAFNLGDNSVEIEKRKQPDFVAKPLREILLSPVSLYTSPRKCSWARTHAETCLARIPEFLGSDKIYLPYPVTVSRHINPVPSGDRQPRVGIYGSPTVESRIEKILQSLRDFSIELVWLTSEREVLRAKRLATEYGLTNVKIIPEDSLNAWGKILPSLDFTFLPYFGEKGGLGPKIALSLAAGVPTIVSDTDENTYLPDSVVFKVTPGDQEVLAFREYLKSLLDLSPRDLDILKANFRSYALENHAAEIVGRELCAVFTRAVTELKSLKSRWQEVTKKARADVVERNLADYDQSLVGSTFDEMGWR